MKLSKLIESIEKSTGKKVILKESNFNYGFIVQNFFKPEIKKLGSEYVLSFLSTPISFAIKNKAKGKNIFLRELEKSISGFKFLYSVDKEKDNRVFLSGSKDDLKNWIKIAFIDCPNEHTKEEGENLLKKL